MSNSNQEAGFEPRRFAEALGSEPPIYVGRTSLIGALTGEALQWVRMAKRAREIASGEEVNSVARDLAKLVEQVDGDPEESYSARQKDAIAQSICSLTFIHDRLDELDDDSVLRLLFEEYFKDQFLLTETTAGHILRMLGDNYAIEHDIDFDHAWSIYQAVLRRQDHPDTHF